MSLFLNFSQCGVVKEVAHLVLVLLLQVITSYVIWLSTIQEKLELACQCNYSYSMNGLNHVSLLCIRSSFSTNAIGWDGMGVVTFFGTNNATQCFSY